MNVRFCLSYDYKTTLKKSWVFVMKRLRFCCTNVTLLWLSVHNITFNMEITREERSGSVVECLTQDQGAAGFSLIGGTVLCP